MTGGISVSVQAAPNDAASWIALAQRVEALGFTGLFVADHPGSGPAPFVALAAAAAVTRRITLGTYVANAGAWEPLALASEVATLDVVSGGRAILGVGAGHTPAEWRMRGLPYPTPGGRVDRMVELVDATRALLAGEQVTLDGEHVALVEARLDEPTPVQRPIPLLVGGSGRRVMAYAAEHADIVGLAGLGRTLEDGHRHEVRWRDSQIDETIQRVHAAARAAGRSPALEALVQHVEVADDADAAAAAFAAEVPGLEPADLLGAPFVWIGTVEQIADRLRGHRERWGITRYVIRPPAIDTAVEVLARLR
ncbi:MAG TPA: TIGR03621 family F420-dependent LLM class oxidoreductase [Egicoccus sp.]|nr:TIGR03621 family F420-dependent LLM class oxidoreductase [Egicoccus sp.]HSK23199.1 TIGR03621 family F420-dependent LLM class oxidoreductase [Egicoccus sp.]